jgi:hypothetical protein
MSEPEDDDYLSKQSQEMLLWVAHFQLTQWRDPPLSGAQKEKILQLQGVSRAEYEQYVIDRREREEREEKEDRAQTAANWARRENDPAHWKRMYQDMVEREEERKRTRDMYLGYVMVCGVFVAILYFLRIFNIF